MTDTTLPPEVAEAAMPIQRWHATGDYAYPAEECADGEFVAYDEHCAEVDRLKGDLHRLAEENARLRPMLTARSQEMLRLVSESGELKTRAEKAEARVQELQDALRDDSARIVREWDDERAVWKQRAERAESEVAAIKRRIAEAPVARVNARNITEPLQLRDADPDVLNLHDHRVRLLPLDDEEPKQ